MKVFRDRRRTAPFAVLSMRGVFALALLVTLCRQNVDAGGWIVATARAHAHLMPETTRVLSLQLIAILKYRLAHQSLPSKLSETGAVLRDPFSGLPFRYVLWKSGFYLYAQRSRNVDLGGLMVNQKSSEPTVIFPTGLH